MSLGFFNRKQSQANAMKNAENAEALLGLLMSVRYWNFPIPAYRKNLQLYPQRNQTRLECLRIYAMYMDRIHRQN